MGAMIIDGFVHQLPDTDPAETQEWLDSLDAVVGAQGKTRARFLVSKLLERARELQVGHPGHGLHAVRQHHPAGGGAVVPRRRGHRAPHPRLHPLERRGDGGEGQQARRRHRRPPLHLRRRRPRSTRSASTTSSAARTTAWPATTSTSRATPRPASTPGPSSRAGSPRTSSTTSAARSAAAACRPTPTRGSCPTSGSTPRCRWASARSARSTRPASTATSTTASSTTPTQSRVWCFLGDGECDEPETLGSISLAAREGLDNLIWVVNCNLQRLDGPVRGNGKIIQELEAVFRGAGWNVIKVIWGGKWDELLPGDVDGVLLDKMNTTVDGEFQRYAVESGAYIREHFFGPDPRLRQLVEHLSDEELRNLPRGGHDYRKLYAAYKAATEQDGRPHGHPGQDDQGLDARPRRRGPQRHPPDQEDDHRPAAACCASACTSQDEIPEEALADDEEPPYIPLARRQRGRAVPARSAARRSTARSPGARTAARRARSSCPPTAAFDRGARRLGQAGGVDHHGVHPAAAQPVPRRDVRPAGRADHPRRGPHLRHGRAVQGVRDLRVEGPEYEPVDHDLLLSYKESQDGQILEEGITEAGSLASFIAAGTSLRHPGRADGAVLHLLFDVRLPAGGRPHLAGRRRPGPRLPARRHRRAHHAARRGPAAPGRPQPRAGLGQPGRRGLRPGLRLRGGRDRPRRPAAHVRPRARTSSTT